MKQIPRTKVSRCHYCISLDSMVWTNWKLAITSVHSIFVRDTAPPEKKTFFFRHKLY